MGNKHLQNNYNRTKIPLGVVSVGTIVAAVIFRLVARDFLGTLGTIFRAAVMGGGTVYFLTLYLNRELADTELNSETFDIIETGNLAKGKRGNCRQPYAIIDFYGYEKQLLFYCDDEKNIQTYKKVQVDYFKGYFNFPVVHDQALTP